LNQVFLLHPSPDPCDRSPLLALPSTDSPPKNLENPFLIGKMIRYDSVSFPPILEPRCPLPSFFQTREIRFQECPLLARPPDCRPALKDVPPHRPEPWTSPSYNAPNDGYPPFSPLFPWLPQHACPAGTSEDTQVLPCTDFAKWRLILSSRLSGGSTRLHLVRVALIDSEK